MALCDLILVPCLPHSHPHLLSHSITATLVCCWSSHTAGPLLPQGLWACCSVWTALQPHLPRAHSLTPFTREPFPTNQLTEHCHHFLSRRQSFLSGLFTAGSELEFHFSSLGKPSNPANTQNPLFKYFVPSFSPQCPPTPSMFLSQS